jgi:predicted RNA-binding protein with PIN domain
LREGHAVPYLIDGYNLLFAYLGAPPARGLSRGLERARRRLLELVHSRHDGEPAEVTVVFDAAHAPPGAPAELDYRGVHVVFTPAESADERIEGLIRKASAPRQLTIVTDDHHIQQAARRRRCTVLGCADYLGIIEGSVKAAAPQGETPAAKPQTASPDETARWLGEFADLARDPAMKELADPFGLGANPELPEE